MVAIFTVCTGCAFRVFTARSGLQINRSTVFPCQFGHHQHTVDLRRYQRDRCYLSDCEAIGEKDAETTARPTGRGERSETRLDGPRNEMRRYCGDVTRHRQILYKQLNRPAELYQADGAKNGDFPPLHIRVCACMCGFR